MPVEERGEAARTVTLLLCGDVMLGRGIDQILMRPGDPLLAEPYLRDARQYVDLADESSGQPVPRPVPDTWPWGEALDEIQRSRPAVLVANLETSVTRCPEFVPGKQIHYRMSPANLGALRVAEPDVCVLANNHVLDFGRRGLAETVQTLRAAGLRTAGAGGDGASATAPAILPSETHPPVAVLAYGHESSGVGAGWAASAERSGVALLPDLSAGTADLVAERVALEKERGAVVVLSLHWGSNWGYHVAREQTRFAHRMIDAGADIVHGHSSHHPRPIEIYRDRLVLYGCGDIVNDYEGISGHERYRDDLRLLYRVQLAADGRLVGAELVPFRSRRLRLERASASDAGWLASVLDRRSRACGVHVQSSTDVLELG